MPKTEWLPTFSGKAQGALRRRSQAVRRWAMEAGSSAANSGVPGLKWS
jgi:hypothetical protein